MKTWNTFLGLFLINIEIQVNICEIKLVSSSNKYKNGYMEKIKLLWIIKHKLILKTLMNYLYKLLVYFFILLVILILFPLIKYFL